MPFLLFEGNFRKILKFFKVKLPLLLKVLGKIKNSLKTNIRLLLIKNPRINPLIIIKKNIKILLFIKPPYKYFLIIIINFLL